MCMWPEKRKHKERVLYASTLHRLTHKSPPSPCAERVCMKASERVREGGRTQILNHPTLKWEKKVLKLERKERWIKRTTKISFCNFLLLPLGRWITFGVSIPSKLVLKGWISQGSPVDFKAQEGVMWDQNNSLFYLSAPKLCVALCDSCVSLLSAALVVRYPVWNHWKRRILLFFF